nr:MAG TPA: hypothetical protein [Caudoviricetes sp.]
MEQWEIVSKISWILWSRKLNMRWIYESKRKSAKLKQL